MKKSTASVVFDAFNALGMIVLSLMMVFPFYYILVYSFSDSRLMGSGLVYWPVGVNVEAYKTILQDQRILNSALVSAVRTLTGPTLMIAITSMAGFALTHDRLRGVKALRRYFVFTMYMGAGIIPMYLLIKNLGMIGTFWVYIIPSSVSVYNMVLIKTYIESIPTSLEEAARIDGANEFTAFWRVIFPVCMPVIAATGLFSAVGHWNDFVDTQFYNNMNPRLFTLQYMLYQVLASAESLAQAKNQAALGRQVLPQSLKMAVTVITVLPIAMVYPLVQKHFAKGLMIGAVKG